MKNIDILRHMKEDIEDIQQFVSNCSFEDFIQNKIVKKAVCMSLINIGELSKSLSSTYRSEHKEIPWKNIAGLRDVTAHKYHTLNLDIVWAVVTIEIPKLEAFIDNQLEKHQSNP